MSQWNIVNILLYNIDNRRRRVVEFIPGSVNIITGRSNRGKSSLVEIIDYAMGSSECHIPGLVRDHCSWVGLLWTNGSMHFLMCRRLPKPQNKSSDDVFIDIGSKVVPPSASAFIIKNTNVDGGLRRFEQLLGIGDVETDPQIIKTSRVPSRISARNIIPYILQDGNTIISNIKLLRGSDSDQRQSIIDSLPYFLGVVNESYFSKKSQLRGLKHKLTNEQRKAAAIERIKGEDIIRARTLLREAVQLNMISEPSNETSFQELINLLKGINNWSASNVAYSERDQLSDLYEQERELTSQLYQRRLKLRSSKNTLGIADGFSNSVSHQIRRLEVVQVLPAQESQHACPLCAQPLVEVTDSIQNIRDIFQKVSTELNDVERERPRLDRYIIEQQNEIDDNIEQLRTIRREIAGIIRETETINNGYAIEQRRFRVIGRISLFLDALEPDSLDYDASIISHLESQIRDLELEINQAPILEAIEHSRSRLSLLASSIITALPFEQRYANNPVDFNLKDLTIGVMTPNRRELMRGVGGDENYLSFHIAFMLSFHRYFSSLDSPVPRVLLLDQLSRPFFPQDPENEQEEIIISANEEKEDLKRYFDILFSEVITNSGLQIIILEHAYFSDDLRFVTATRERWNSTGLIPEDWILPQNSIIQLELNFEDI